MVPGPRERRPKSSGSPIAYQVDRVEHLSPDKLFLGFWDFFLFLKMDQLDLGTCPGTQPGTWTHGRYTGSKFHFSELTGPGFTYQVHRVEVLATDEKIFGDFFFILSTWTPYTWELYQVHREGGLAPGERIFGDFLYSLKMDRLHLGALPGSQGRGPGAG